MATIYISPSGNDTTGNGTEGNPYQTIAKFLAVSSPSDTCRMAAGTYTWVANQDVSNRTFVGESALTTILDAANGYVFWKAQGTVNISNVTFYRNNANASSSYGNINCRGVFVPISGAAVTWNFSTCIFSTFVVTQSYNYLGGIFSAASILSGGYGTDYANSTFTLVGCLFKELSAVGTGYNRVIFSANCVVTNCTFYFTEISIPLGGINEKTATITNCIFNNVGTSFAFGSANLSYSCVNGISSPPAGTGNIISDPLLIDPTNGNFRLRPTSPCLNAGIAV